MKKLKSGTALSALLLAFAACAGSAEAQDGSTPGAEAMPWGPAVPRSLHGATLTYRQRALDHCVRVRMAYQGIRKPDATEACLVARAAPSDRPTQALLPSRSQGASPN